MIYHPQVERIARGLKQLHERWKPHDAQIAIGRALIGDRKKDIFAQCGRNFGKALDLETDIPTPNGWRKLKDISPGDYVFDENGQPTLVIGESPIFTDHKCYELTFDDGSTLVADEQHNWLTHSKKERKRFKSPSKRSTEEIANSILAGKEYNHQIQNCHPVQYPHSQLPIPAYTLGVWLGNGNAHQATLSQWDKEVLEFVKDDGFEVSNYTEENGHGVLGLLPLLKKHQLLKNKHIPTVYLTASIDQRKAILAGLMDTDGTVSKSGNCCFDNTNEDVARGVFEIVQSLGIKATFKKRVGKLYGVEHKICYRVFFSPPIQVFRLSRKADVLKPHLNKHKRRHRSIVSAKEVEPRPVKCLAVQSDSHLFLVGRQFLVTHNTELVSYLLWRWAWTFPGSENYYFSPYMKQSREILWASRRVQAFGPESWVVKINDNEMRITFSNGSFLKLDGSDNVEAYRGVKPKGLTVFDEFKDFRPEFYEAYDPNRAAYDTPLFIIGTPPEFDGQFNQVASSWAKDSNKAFFKFPTRANPHISSDWLEKKKIELFSRGEQDKWFREYEAEFVRGGSKRIFPMLKETMIKPHGELLKSLEKDKRRLEWFCVADPAGASTFAVLFAAINPYSKNVYLLDEIYEQRQEEMTVARIGARIIQKTKALYKGDWRFIYDEAEAWFANEMLEQYQINFEPTQKAKHDKTTGLSLIKDVMLANKWQVSEYCQKWFWEADNYQKDNEGRLIKKHDHLLDCSRYLLGASYYSLNELKEESKESDSMWRGARIEDDFPDFDESGERKDSWGY